MVRRLVKPAFIAIATIASSLVACDARKKASIGNLEVGVPPAFSQENDREVLSLSANEAVGVYRPRVSITRYDRVLREADIKKELAELKKLRNIELSELDQTRYGDQEAWSYSMRYVDAGALMVHDRKQVEPSQVDSRKVTVYIPYAEQTYSLVFRCPEELYEKYRPEFDAVLRSLRFKD